MNIFVYSLVNYTVVFVCLLVCIVGCSPKEPVSQRFYPQKDLHVTEKSTIVCFGDSLTSGYGAESIKDSYPMVLQQWVSIPVINAGVADDTTEKAKYRFRREVLEKEPIIIIFDFGGNDIYTSKPRLNIEQIETNFRLMLDQIEFATTQVYIVRYYNDQMRFFDLFFRFDRMLNRLEKDYEVAIIRNIWQGVWGHKEMKFNMTHPNSRGYRVVAENVFAAIKPALAHNHLLLKP